MLPAFVRVQGIYETVRNFITASWTSGYWRGDCGFENFSKDRLTKGFRNFLSLLQTRCLIILWHKQQSLSSIDVSIQFTSWLHRASIIFNTLITNIGTKCNSLTQQFIGIHGYMGYMFLRLHASVCYWSWILCWLATGSVVFEGLKMTQYSRNM